MRTSRRIMRVPGWSAAAHARLLLAYVRPGGASLYSAIPGVRRLGASQLTNAPALLATLQKERTDTVRVALIRRLSDLGVSETTWRLTRHRLRIAGHDVLGTPISILQADGTQTSNTTQSSGRRAQLLRVESMGRRGNPLDRSWLISQLTRTTDPGHGFALRGAASRSLGRLGDPSAAGALIAAFHDEARHIGTPGAGLGIQRPVRLDVLWALGEIGNPAAGNLLVGALTSDEPAATKPIWHEAALALYKLGSHIEPLLRRSSHERAQRLATLL